MKRTDFHAVVGNPIVINTNGEKIDKKTRQIIADELMYELAALLPEEYRGEYKDLENATTKYLIFS